MDNATIDQATTKIVTTKKALTEPCSNGAKEAKTQWNCATIEPSAKRIQPRIAKRRRYQPPKENHAANERIKDRPPKDRPEQL